MSDFALTTHDFRETPSLGACLRGLFARKPVRPPQPAADLQALSAHLLADIGLDPRDVSRAADEEAFRLSLIERGWRPTWPRRAF